ncbi:MAG: adenylate cyclase, partial [Alphaproteobacteria bacterium]|nr:adenylate cyclase [Alphaproteobacteria bacterium]
GADEVGTLEALKSHRREVLDPTIADHNGRIVKTTGDGLLAEFSSAVDAVSCALLVQSKMAERNRSSVLVIAFRIGINVSDIIVDGEDIFGDGVNVAARVENECEPGSVCLSGSAFEQVVGKPGFAFDDLGERSLKNIERPVRLYAARPAGSAPATGTEAAKRLPFADKPSIAVLPFQNMSGDHEQEYFADGIVEDIITALSRTKWLFVVARNSSFIYKGRTAEIKQVGRELGVRYVLEGSVRKSGNRVRITGQLIEAATQHHIWADRFEGSLEDVFALQDRVTESVVGAIEPSLRKAEILRGRSKPTESLDAYDCYLRAIAALYELTAESQEAGEAYLKRAIELDPHYASAKARYAHALIFRRVQGWAARPDDRGTALALAREALSEGSDDPLVLARVAMALTYFADDNEQAVELANRAVDLHPNSPEVLIMSAWVHCFDCTDPDKSIEQFTRAMRLSPRDPDTARACAGLAFANLIAGRSEDGLRWSQRALREMPHLTVAHRAQILALVRTERIDEARDTARRMMEVDPRFTIATRIPPYRDRAFRNELQTALRNLGLPE